ncbi:Fic family protein [Candidatus Parcubacteria bacterium]|nr:Fic family protein [Candidatus Parcubacteria bacterium]
MSKKKDSTKPKGATSFKETKFGIIPRSKLVKLEADGVGRGLKFIKVQAKQDFLISPELILLIHKKSFAWIFPKWSGKFRKIEVEVSGYQPPDFYKVPVLIKQFCDDLNKRLKHIPPKTTVDKYLEEVVSLTAWAQHRFVWIHPFNDYNGRAARLLTNLIFLKLGLPLLEIKVETRKDRNQYIKAMQLADKHDYLLLEEIISSALQEALKKGLLE